MKNLLYFFILISSLSYAQDLSGRWVAITGYDSGYYAELYLVQNDKNVYAGHCYDTQEGGYCRHWLDATYNPDTKEFIGLDMELIQKSYSHEPTDYILKYEKGENGKEYLVGTSGTIPYFMRPNGIMRPNKAQLFDLRFRSRSIPNVVRYVKVSDDYKIYNDEMPLAMTEDQIMFEKAAFPEVYDEEEVAKLNELHDLQKAPDVISFPNILDIPMRRNRPNPPAPEAPELPKAPEELAEAEEIIPEEEVVAIPEEEIKTEETQPEVEVEGYVSVEPKKEEVEVSITEKKEKRSNQIFSHLRLKTNKVTLLIMDYGTIDNDTVTVFYNDKIIADGIRLTHTAAEFELELDPNKRNELTFVANNLGDVPPNTARITLIADDKRYNYRLFSDEQTNAVILLENVGRMEEED
ncbi:hypothetical protein NMK71_11490 [Weeksellaceae bacterium KMM 9713]|uniref:DUF4488 domain-containing protein n=1 Tax=Profundicola chukchiensis TaxID=2961959 RepID=A0A9X4N086_9FLAO|nr:hypothetical protein [Profundicola chukchiensis]MDG4947035.1 hypothetical protein [Profundicola chukchiensis]